KTKDPIEVDIFPEKIKGLEIFQTPVRKYDVMDSAALGAALRSMKSYFNSIKEQKSWKNIVSDFLDLQHSILITHDTKTKELYDDMLILYKKFEDYILQNGENPEVYRKNFLKKYFTK
ncbi:MAG: hypothetical protein ACFFAO_22010, partial [Candidatus Hermodarchaeota archaeon]